MTEPSVGRSGLTRRNLSRGDTVFRVILTVLALGIVAIAVLSAYELFVGGRSALARYGLGFFTTAVWDPVLENFGAITFIVGTLLTSFLALLISVPLAIASALFVTEYAPPWLAEPISYLVELLAAIPSVVYGLWAVFVLVPIIRNIQLGILMNPVLNQVPFLQSPPSGFGLMTAVIILAIMVIPFTSSVARDVIRLVPADQREAAYALGATKWEVIRQAVLPYARAGIFGGVILALGRALGETMAVTMVIGNRPEFPSSIFGPTATMASVIANEFTEAVVDVHLSSLIAVGLILFLLSLVVNYLARILIYRLSPKAVVS